MRWLENVIWNSKENFISLKQMKNDKQKFLNKILNFTKEKFKIFTWSKTWNSLPS